MSFPHVVLRDVFGQSPGLYLAQNISLKSVLRGRHAQPAFNPRVNFKSISLCSRMDKKKSSAHVQDHDTGVGRAAR